MAGIVMAARKARDRKWTQVGEDVGEQLNPETGARFFERAGSPTHVGRERKPV
jgi:hypothetical protein